MLAVGCLNGFGDDVDLQNEEPCIVEPKGPYAAH